MNSSNLKNDDWVCPPGIRGFFAIRAEYYRKVFFITLFIIIVFKLILALCTVPTGSMEPTVKPWTQVLVNRMAYIGDKTPQRKDMLSFYMPDEKRKCYLKRCIGLPGEVVTIQDGHVYINGEYLDEPYLAQEYNADFGPYYVPKAGDKVIVVDGNEQTNCYIENSDGIMYLVGYADFIDKYCQVDNENNIVVKDDCYFMLGDNANNSYDARYWKNMYITEDDIIGETFMSIFPKLQFF